MTLDVAGALAGMLASLGKPFDYSVYLLFGLLFGLIPLLPRSKTDCDSDTRRRPTLRLHALATCGVLGTCLMLVGPSFARVSVPSALLSAGIVVALSKQRSLLIACKGFWPTLLTFHAVLLLLDHPFKPETGTNTISLVVSFALSFAFVWVSLSGRLEHLESVLSPLAHLVLTATMLVFARTMVSLSTVPRAAQQHWGAIIGPVELMHSGGRVLYDIPLQYGLLNTLIVSFISWLIGDSWIGFQWFFQVTTALQGLLFYLVVGRLLHGVPMRWPAAAAATIGSLYLMQGLDCCLGTYVSPAIGMFRFLPIWLQIAYVVCFWERLDDRLFYGGGCAIWIVGCSWSAEILLLTTGIWFGCVALRVASTASTSIVSWRFARAVTLVLLAHAVVVVLALAFGIGLYAAAYRDLPDLPRYFDFLFTISDTGWFAVRATQFPASVVPVLAAVLTTIGLGRLTRVGAPSATVATAYVASLGFWAATSYFASRSLPIIISYLSPYILMALLALVRWPADVDSVRGVMTVAFCAAFLALPIGFTGDERRRVFETALQPQPSLVSLMPWYEGPAGDAVSKVVEDSGESTIPLISLGEMVPDEGWPPGARARFPTPRLWLPMVPESVLIPLPHSLRALYVRRWVARARQPGWVVIERTTHFRTESLQGGLDFVDAEELQEYLGSDYVVTVDEIRGLYRVMRFEPRRPPE